MAAQYLKGNFLSICLKGFEIRDEVPGMKYSSNSVKDKKDMNIGLIPSEYRQN